MINRVSDFDISWGLSKAVKFGHKDIIRYLAFAMPDEIPDEIREIIRAGYVDIAEALIATYPSPQTRRWAFREYCETGHYEEMLKLLDSATNRDILDALQWTIEAHKYETAKELLQWASLEAVDHAARLLSLEQPLHELFYEIIDLTSSKRRVSVLRKLGDRKEGMELLASKMSDCVENDCYYSAVERGDVEMIFATVPYIDSLLLKYYFSEAFAADNYVVLKALITRVPRHVLLKIEPAVLETKSKEMQAIINQWKKIQVPIDVRFEYASCMAAPSICTSLEDEAGRLGVDLLLCSTAGECIEQMSRFGPKTSPGAVERTVERASMLRPQDSVLELVLPFATTYVCDTLLKEAIKEPLLEDSALKCIDKASEQAILELAMHAFETDRERLLAGLLPKLPVYGGWELLKDGVDIDAPLSRCCTISSTRSTLP